MSPAGSPGAASTQPYLASLRVYEPLSAFTGTDRVHWMTYLARADRPTNEEVVHAEHQGALRRTMALPVEVAPQGEHAGALVLVVDGKPFVCPLDDRLRAWTAVEEFADEVPEPILSAFLPGRVAGRALADYATWRRQNARQARIRTALWHVPAEWFSLFEPGERELEVEEGRPPALRCRTTMGHARRRAARALDVVRRSLGDGPLSVDVETLARWLEEYHPRSHVELDYGGLAGLLGVPALAVDTSVEDVADGLAALRQGDAEGAAEAYQRLTARWLPVRALEHSS